MGPRDAGRLDDRGLRRVAGAAVGRARRAAFYAETRPIGRAFGVPEAMLPRDLDGVRRVRRGDARAGRSGARLVRSRASWPRSCSGRRCPRRARPRLPIARRSARTTGRCGRRSGCCRRAVREEYGLALGPRERLVAALACRGLAGLAAAAPRGFRQMPQALAADRRGWPLAPPRRRSVDPREARREQRRPEVDRRRRRRARGGACVVEIPFRLALM